MATTTTTSSLPAAKKREGASQARASETKEEQVVWYGGQNAHQDVCIRLVRDHTINNDVDDGHTVAGLMVHSSRLETCSSYFAAALSKRWTSKRNRSPQELPFHVDGDIRLYTDCFSRMYNPFMVGFESVEYSLQLLAVATHLAYDDLMSSICVYLASVHPWSDEDEMRIRSSVLSEDFPHGHARDVLELLERSLTRDDLRPLITRCMERGMKSWHMRTSSFSSMESARQARDLLTWVLVTAWEQERSPTPTFEQEAVCVINEEFKLLLVAANVEAEAADTMKGNPGLVNIVDTIQQVLDILVVTEMADEAVVSFAQYSSFPKLIRDALRSEPDDARVVLCGYTFTWTVVTMVNHILHRKVHVEDSVRDATLLNWLPLLEWLHRNLDEAFLGMCTETWFTTEYGQVKEALLSISPSSQELKEIIDKVFVP